MHHFKRLRVGALYEHEACTGLGERLVLGPLPFRHLLEIRKLIVLIGESRHRVVAPHHRNVPGTSLVSAPHQRARELSRLDRRHDHQLLPRLNMNALANDKACVPLDLRRQGTHACLGILNRERCFDHDRHSVSLGKATARPKRTT